ncbi:MAG: flagellar type III secretion system pore protein FliP [Pseudomonadota bacterium]
MISLRGLRIGFFAALAGAACALLLSAPADAQEVSVNFTNGEGLTERILQLVALITILSIAPSILFMMTAFIRIVIVLSLLRTALGIQQSPPNPVIIGLALFLTAFVMAPTFEKAYEDGVRPFMDDEIELQQAVPLAAAPMKEFMLSQVREEDLALFIDLAEVETPESPEATPFHVIIPAFMVSELRRAFEIGFLIFIPFLVIDMVIASILMAMGMMMLPPIIISLPFKLIFFVLVDGWRLVAGSLVQSFN